MRLSPSEKAEIIRIVKRSDLGVNRTLKKLGIHKRTFYNWYERYSREGEEGLKPRRQSRIQWNSLPQELKNLVVEIALDAPELSSRELAIKITDEHQIFISESSVYRILKANGLVEPCEHDFLAAADQFRNKTQFVNQMWQTDFTYFKIIGWGWYYLSTVLDDYSRYIIHWELCSNMERGDVKRTIACAMKKAKLTKDNAPVLLSDNGPCYIAKELKTYLNSNFNIRQIHGRPLHPQTQGKIERYHRSMKNVVKLNHYFHPDQLIEAVELWVDYYNNKRYHESLNNLTPADVYFGRGEKILAARKQIKQKSFIKRRQIYHNYCSVNLKSVIL
jgi:Transposase and inactivated derivatives